MNPINPAKILFLTSFLSFLFHIVSCENVRLGFAWFASSFDCEKPLQDSIKFRNYCSLVVFVVVKPVSVEQNFVHVHGGYDLFAVAVVLRNIFNFFFQSFRVRDLRVSKTEYEYVDVTRKRCIP